MTHRWTVGLRSKRTYVFFLFCVKRVAQLLLQDLNFISQFNFIKTCLTLLPIKHLEKALCQVDFFPIICIQAIYLHPLPWWSSVFVFQLLFFSIVFRLCHHTGQVISSPDLALSFTSVLWLMNVSKWFSC